MGNAAGELPEAARRLLTLAQSNGRRLISLVNDSLDIGKLESGQVTFKFEVPRQLYCAAFLPASVTTLGSTSRYGPMKKALPLPSP